jgi:hypothetical protein
MKYTLFLFKFVWACILTLIWLICIPFTFVTYTLFLFIWDFKYHKYDFEYYPSHDMIDVSFYDTDSYITYKTYFHYIWNIRPKEKQYDDYV